MPRRKSDVEAALKQKGFRQQNRKHRFFTYYTLNGELTAVRTMTSHGHKEIADRILSMMAKQVGLTTPQFQELLDCPLEQGAFEALLRESGRIR